MSAHTPTIYMLQGPPRRLEPIRREDCARLNGGVGVDGMPLVSIVDYDALQSRQNALIEIAERYASECAECGGHGHFASHREDPGGHSVLECWECEDIRAALKSVRGAP